MPLILTHDYQVQKYGWNCGPTATRCALSTRNVLVSQDKLIQECGTTVDGTNWIGQITPVLTRHSRAAYRHRLISNDPPSREQTDLLWDDIAGSIRNGYGVVANIVAPPNNHPPGYPNTTIFHYIAIVGINEANRQVYVADSANFGGINHYWLPIAKLASLITPKGYAIGPGTPGVDVGKILAFKRGFMSAVNSDADDCDDQLTTKWPQLGNRTLVDALAKVLEVVTHG